MFPRGRKRSRKLNKLCHILFSNPTAYTCVLTNKISLKEDIKSSTRENGSEKNQFKPVILNSPVKVLTLPPTPESSLT